MASRMYWMHALTPVHIGTGSQVGYVDLPIARERATNWPVVPGSGLKGVMAENFEAADAEKRTPFMRAAFGAADDEEKSQEANAGALVFTDGRLVCLPVRSVLGTFAWATTPVALQRLARDLRDSQHPVPGSVPPVESSSVALIPDTPKSKLASDKNRVYLADLDFEARASKELGVWATKLAEWIFAGDKEWQTVFRERLVLLQDDTFGYFAESATEISTRVRISPETKTVATGALWTEEALPAEAVMAGLLWCDKLHVKKGHREQIGMDEEQLLNHFCKESLPLQVGGKATVGRGRVRLSFSKGSGQ